MLTSTALVLLMIPGVGWVGHSTKTLTGLMTDAHSQFLLLGTGSEEICPIVNMALDDGGRCHLVPMVPLGLLAHFLPYRGKIHRQPRQHRIQKHLGRAFGR